MIQGLIAPIFWMALNVYHEARGEPMEGKVAVVQVVMNRAEFRRQSVIEVIKAPHQFSWTNGIQNPLSVKISSPEAFLACLEAVEICLLDRLNGDTFDGAEYYFNPDKADPSWQNAYTFIRKIGHHKFYRDQKR